MTATAPGAATTFVRDPARALLWLTAAAVSWRWLLATRTLVPAEDGVNYLWMAQCFARGEWGLALSEPFSPLWSLLLALPIACGVEPLLAGQVLGCVCGGLALLPIAAIAERLRPGAGPIAAALAATSSVFARTAPEVLTEPLFVLVAGGAVLAGLRQRPVALGVGCGLAFWVRPEGALLVVPFVLLAPRRHWPAAAIAAALVALLGAWRLWCGHGFDPLPKLAFHELRVDLGDERGDLVGNLLRVAPVFFEAFAAAAVLAVASLWPARRPRDASVRADLRALWLLLGLGTLVIATFVVRRRFFITWTPVVLPLAAVALARIPWLGPRGMELVLAAVCGLDLYTAWNGTIDLDRIGERLVGQHLARHLGEGRTVAGDMTRVLWFAGQRPLPPRHFDAAWFVAQARRPEVEYVVLHEASRRGVYGDVAKAIAGEFVRLDLPSGLRDPAAARGIAVFVRR